MKQIYQSDNRKFCLYITIKTKTKKVFRTWAEDYGKRNSKYADRVVEVDGERTIYFSFPVSPKVLFIGVLNSAMPQDQDFEVILKEGQLRSYNVWIDAQTKDFLDLSIPFCQISGFRNPNSKGLLFTKGDFNIMYYDVIRDPLSGNVLRTPARIGHSTGKIDVSKAAFDKYTVAMRMMILLHEFSHKFKNPNIGLEISNEIGADINALYIYLGLGFSKIDAICVFANVFLKAQNEANMTRMRKINDYIQKFENQEFAKLN